MRSKNLEPIKFDEQDRKSIAERMHAGEKPLSPLEQRRQILSQMSTIAGTPEGRRAFQRVAMLTGK